MAFRDFFVPSSLFKGALLALLAATSLHALELHPDRSSPFDLEVKGRLEGVPAGESRYVRWAELRAMPLTQLKLEGEFMHGEQAVTVVFVEDVLKALPLAAGADTLLAECKDRYASVYPHDFVEKYRPFFVLEINGVGPEKWVPPAFHHSPGPYVITVADAVAPGASQFLDIGHKKPWGTVAIEVVNYDERFKGAYTGRWAELSASAQAGRKIWINSCASCHQGPNGLFGGDKSERPFMVVQAIAGYNADYFKKYVHAPTSVNPAAKMEAHPHYTDEQLDALIAFITADGKK